MRALYQAEKRADEQISVVIDSNPWLQSIFSTFQGVVVGDAPDVVEGYAVQAGVITLTVSGGNEGTSYRIPVTVTAANGTSRATVVEVDVLAIAGAPSSSNPGGGASVQDSLTGNPTNVAPSVRAVNEALAALWTYLGVGGGVNPNAILDEAGLVLLDETGAAILQE